MTRLLALVALSAFLLGAKCSGSEIVVPPKPAPGCNEACHHLLSIPNCQEPNESLERCTQECKKAVDDGWGVPFECVMQVTSCDPADLGGHLGLDVCPLVPPPSAEGRPASAKPPTLFGVAP